MFDINNIVLDQKTIEDAYNLMEQNVLALRQHLKKQEAKILTVSFEELSHQLGISALELRDSAAVLLCTGFISNIDTGRGDKVLVHLH